MSNHLNSQSFAECVNTVFAVQTSAAERLPLELISVTEKNHSPALEHFALIFRGPVSPILSQGTHSMENEKLGTIEIFLVPVGPDGTGPGICYEAIFNRFRSDVPAKPQ